MDEDKKVMGVPPPPRGEEACRECGACGKACALLEEYGSPEVMWRAENAEELAYRCTLCGRCDALCPTDVDVTGRFREIREAAYREGRHPRRAWRGRRIFEALGKSRPFRAYFTRPASQDLFFPGCNLSGIRPESARKMWEELDALSPGIGMALDCCGVISRDVGDRESYRRHAERMREELERRGVRRILTACPSCARSLRAMELPVEVRSAYELLSAAPSASGRDRGEALLHEPCSAHLDPEFGRSVRSLALRSGFTVGRPPRALRGSICCSDVRWEGGEGDPTLLTACAGCFQTISRGATNPGKVRHLLDVRYGAGEGKGAPGLIRQFRNRLGLRRRFAALFGSDESGR